MTKIIDASRNSLYKELNNRNPLELIDELDAKIDEMTEYDFDGKLVTTYLDVLQQKAPIVEEFDDEQFLQDFLEKFPTLYEAAILDPPKQRAPKRRYRIAGAIAAAACLIFAAILVPIDASGHTFLNKIVHWGEEVLIIKRLPPSGKMTFPADSESEYRSLADALEKNGISPTNCPTWIPAGFAINEVALSENDTTKTFVAIYQNAENTIYVQVRHCKGHLAAIFAEKDPTSSVYKSNGQEYYIFENFRVINAVWDDDNSTYQIFGDISIDDLHTMIDSIQGRR
ncbi:MAG: DUF4367 domain-containing protein [Prevotellaceae bacterium]|nr:DUF4367 domain-containing protein [Prevotellaceae bacterium]